MQSNAKCLGPQEHRLPLLPGAQGNDTLVHGVRQRTAEAESANFVCFHSKKLRAIHPSLGHASGCEAQASALHATPFANASNPQRNQSRGPVYHRRSLQHSRSVEATCLRDRWNAPPQPALLPPLTHREVSPGPGLV